MPRSTKAQIQIGETVAVLVVFLILMVFGLYWFSTASGAQASQERAELERLELVEVTKTIMNMPELQCSTAARTDTTCIDKYRLTAFNTLIQDNESFSAYYREQFFANTRASYSLRLIDLADNEKTYPIFDYTTDDENASSQEAAVPVILHDPVTRENHFSMVVLRQEVAS